MTGQSSTSHLPAGTAKQSQKDNRKDAKKIAKDAMKEIAHDRYYDLLLFAFFACLGVLCGYILGGESRRHEAAKKDTELTKPKISFFVF